MIKCCAVLLAVACGLGAASVPGPAPKADYLGGTVRSIPAHTVGDLDLSDSKDLQFKFGTLAYRLPYERIRNVDFSEPSGRSRALAHVRLPRRHAQGVRMLDLSFRENTGGLGRMSFRLSGGALASVQSQLSERIDAHKQPGEAGSRTKLPESWWGDQFWKTNRNKSAWADLAGDGAK